MATSRFPYGNAFIIGTPHIDQLSNQLYQEQRQRELYQQQQQKALDDEFSKELIGVRRIDIPEVAKSYNDFKQANIGVQKLGNKATPQDHFNVLQAKANMYSTISGSKQQKAMEQSIGSGLLSKPDNYEDNAHDNLIKSMNTPLSQLGELANHDYSYKGSNTDFGKIFKEAAGTPKNSYTENTPMDKNGEQTLVTPYQYGSTPLQYHDYIIGALAKHGAGRDAADMVGKMEPSTIQTIQDEYNAIPLDKFKKMGLDKPQDLTINPSDSKAEIFAKHSAQLYALNNEPKAGKPSTIDNKAIARAENQKFAVAQQKRGADYAMDRVLATLHEKRTLDNEDDFKGIASILNNTKDIIDSGTPIKDPVGNDDKSIVTISDFNLLKAFSNIKGYKPDAITFDKSKDQFNVTYNAKSYTDANGTVHSKEAETIPVSSRDYLRLKVDEMNPKNKGKTNANIDKIITENGGLLPALNKVFSPDATNQQNTKITTSQTKTYKLGDKEITDEQLQKGAKKYKMSVDQYKKSIGL